MPAPTAQRYLTTEDVAQRFCTTASTVRYWRHIGKGPRSFRLGRRVLYSVEVVEAFEREEQAEQYAKQDQRAAGVA